MFLSRGNRPISVEKSPFSERKKSNEKPNHSGTHSLEASTSANVVEDSRLITLKDQATESSVPGITGVLAINKDITWKKVFLDIRSFSTTILGTIEGSLPGAVCLKAVELSGDKDIKNLPTRTLAVAKPKSISGHVVAADITAFSVIYEMSNVQRLQDVTDVSSLSFYITAVGSDEKVIPPYANEVVVECAILGVK